jgi:hypothetical protein
MTGPPGYPRDLAVDSGQALLDLGDTERAHHLSSEGERPLPESRGKTRGVFLAYRAASYLDLKEAEPAVAAATQSPLLARHTEAPRCVRLIEDLLPRVRGQEGLRTLAKERLDGSTSPGPLQA